MAVESVAIVGASLAGTRCATALRRGGFEGTVTIIGSESAAPYDRPPLSKQFLSGEWETDRLALLKPEQHEALDADWRSGVRAESLDAGRRTLVLSDGSTVTADRIVIATGAEPRRLPGTEDLTGVHLLRTLDDAAALRVSLAPPAKRRVVVVGAGFIGAEVAATAASLGHDVVIVEAAPVPMERGLGAEMGAVCGSLHAEHGVRLLLGTAVESVQSEDGAVTSVSLSTGEVLPTDELVVGIGVVPATGWLDGSGLHLDDGVVCDAFCEAAPGVYAAGDVARWPNEGFGQVMRVEHWDNAVEQGMYVARRILGTEDAPFAPVPWFWSDQYEHKIQMAGRPGPDDEVRIVTGSIDERRFAAIYGDGTRLTGVFGLNRPRHVMQYRRLMTDGATWDDAVAHAEAAAAS